MKKESINILQSTLDKLVEKHTSLINFRKYNKALNVMKNIEAVTRQLKDLGVSIIIEEKNNQFLDWYNLLKFFIDSKQSQLIELDYSSMENEKKHRGTGKTTALFKLSNDYNIPILVENYQNEHIDLISRANDMGFHILVVDRKMLNLPQFRHKEIILVDEKISLELYKNSLRDNILDEKIIIGFKTKTKS